MAQAYNLYRFQHNPGKIDWSTIKKQEVLSNLTARVCGYYYEGQILEQLGKLSNSKVELDTNQLSAKEKFEKVYSSNSKYAPASIELKNAIEMSAKIAAEEWYKILQNKVKNTNITIKISNVEMNAALGDIKAILSDGVETQELILEVKWQNLENKPIQWLNMVDESLFSYYTYEQFLKDNDELYWSHRVPDEIWEKNISTTTLSYFLDSNYSSGDGGVLRYLLDKGGKGTDDNGQKASAKYVAHGTKSETTVIGLSEIGEAIGVQEGISEMKFTNFYAKQTYYKYFISFSDTEGNENALFGIDQFNGNKKENTKFRFLMYISQKLFNAK